MSDNNTQELISFFESSGLNSKTLINEVLTKCKLGLPNFDVLHRMDFGEEQMQFRIFITRDSKSNNYKPEKISATLRSAITIEPENNARPDIAAIETQMKSIDWYKYFLNNGKDLTQREFENINNVLLQLWTLEETKNRSNGVSIGKLLQYKYWPDFVVGKIKEDFKFFYEHEQTFHLKDKRPFNVNYAYYSLSCMLDDLIEKLSCLNIQKYMKGDVEGQVTNYISKNGSDKDFTLSFSYNDPSGYFDFEIPVHRLDDEFALDEYKIIFTPYPEIQHGVYNDIDTKELEGRMQKIDWHDDDELFIFHEDAEPSFNSHVDYVQSQMHILSKGLVGAEIADKLMLKYWADATFFSDMLQQTAWDYLEGLPKIERSFDAAIEIPVAINMLHGRAVMAKYFSPLMDDSDKWMRLNLSEGASSYSYITTQDFSAQEVENLLNLLPINGFGFYSTRDGLLKGNLEKVRLTTQSTVLMKANPEEKTIDIYTTDMRRIHTNLTLDPNWKMPPQKKPAKAFKTKMERIPDDKKSKGRKR